MSNFLSVAELRALGVKLIGSPNSIQVSKNATFFRPENVTLRSYARIDDGVVLSAHGSIDVGHYVHIARNSLLYSGTRVVLGDFCGISSNCQIYGMSDNFDGNYLGPTAPPEHRDVRKADVVFSSYTALGSSCVVLPQTFLQEGCILGALSLAKGSYDAWSIYAGNPTRFIKTRQNGCKTRGESLLRQLKEDY